MRLIDADELLETLTPDPIEEAGCPEPEWLSELAEIIKETPESIVRCRDCNSYDGGECRWWQDKVYPHGFCNFGRRKT